MMRHPDRGNDTVENVLDVIHCVSAMHNCVQVDVGHGSGPSGTQLGRLAVCIAAAAVVVLHLR